MRGEVDTALRARATSARARASRADACDTRARRAFELMFHARTVDGATPELRLEDDEAETSAVIVPARGAIVSSFRAMGRELLYLDEATLRDPTANVRGGVPVLFPSPGKLASDRFRRGGREGAMKQHGFARRRPFDVVSTSADGAARAVMRLESDAETLSEFPFAFRLELTISLAGRALTLAVAVANTGDAPLPFGFGLHPYFAVSDKARARVPTAATRAFDNVKKLEAPITAPIDLAHGEVDLHLVDHGRARAELVIDGAPSVALAASESFGRWVLWTLPAKPFVCVEPWTCPADALNTGEGLMELAPGASWTGWVKIVAS